MPESEPLPSDELESIVLDSAPGGPVQPEQLVAGNYQAVYRYAYRLCGSQSTAEDITQETFLQALRNLAQLRCDQALLGWLLAIARRIFLRSLPKSSGGRCQVLQSLDAVGAQVDQTLASRSISRVDEIQALEDRDSLQSALAQLGADARLIVLMFYFEELSYAEIATQLQIPMGTVMSRLNRSRQALRRALEGDRDPPPLASANPELIHPGVPRQHSHSQTLPNGPVSGPSESSTTSTVTSSVSVTSSVTSSVNTSVNTSVNSSLSAGGPRR